LQDQDKNNFLTKQRLIVYNVLQMPANLTQEKFFRQLNTLFQIRSESIDSVDLKLIEVKMITNSEAFSLLFVGPSANFLHQHTYKFRHAEMGEFDLFIVPVGQRDDGYIYQAIFNPTAVSAG
jgi:hypothetical protein